MGKRPQGWRNEPTRHSLASRGIRTTGRRKVIKRRVIPFSYDETSGAWQDEFGIDLRRLGYHYLEDWDSDDTGLVILNPLMLEDPDVISLLGRHGILTEHQQILGYEGYTTDELEGTIYVHIKSKHPHATHDDIAMSINNMSMIQRKKLYDDIKKEWNSFWENTKTYNGEKYLQANRYPIARKSDAMKLLKSYQKRGHGAHLEGEEGNWTIYVTRYAGKGPLLP